MEVLLLQDIPGVGKKNDIIVVGNGFALNNLLPFRRALVATPTVRRRYADAIKHRAEEKQREMALKTGTAGKIAGKELHFARKVTKTGKLYAAITEKHVVEAIMKNFGVEIAEDAIVLAEHIKSVGTFPISVKFGEGTVEAQIVVEEEKETKAKAKAKK